MNYVPVPGRNVVVCNVCCCSVALGSWPQHLAGKKHRATQQGASSSSKNSTNHRQSSLRTLNPNMMTDRTHGHFSSTITGEPAPSTFTRSVKTPTSITPAQATQLLEREFQLFKMENQEVKEESHGSSLKLAPIFLPQTKTKQKSKHSYNARFKDAFKRKRTVNLYISSGKVNWEFAYNQLIIDAIKEYIPGREWNPSVKRWTCPIESL
jgi:hypothetical protein